MLRCSINNVHKNKKHRRRRKVCRHCKETLFITLFLYFICLYGSFHKKNIKIVYKKKKLFFFFIIIAIYLFRTVLKNMFLFFFFFKKNFIFLFVSACFFYYYY